MDREHSKAEEGDVFNAPAERSRGTASLLLVQEGGPASTTNVLQSGVRSRVATSNQSFVRTALPPRARPRDLRCLQGQHDRLTKGVPKGLPNSDRRSEDAASVQSSGSSTARGSDNRRTTEVSWVRLASTDVLGCGPHCPCGGWWGRLWSRELSNALPVVPQEVQHRLQTTLRAT